MRVFGDFNNISPELKEKVKQLKPGEFARFKLTESVTFSDPDTKQRFTRYPHRQMWAKATIYDKYAERIVDIGIVAPGGYDAKEKSVTAVITFEFDSPETGIMQLDGNRPMDRELYEFLQLDNRLKDGILEENRDISVQLAFVLMDSKKEAIQRNKIFDLKADAFTYIKNLDAQEARDLAAALNWNYDGDLDEVIAQIKAMADEDPAKFNKFIADPLLKKKAIIRRAIGTMIFYDTVNHAFKWSTGSVLATLERKPNQNEVDALAEWLDTVPNGDKILAQLKKAKASAAAVA